jgi:hypothetical protein
MTIPDSTREKVKQLFAAGQKIPAIKVIREDLGVSLAKASRLLDWIATGDPSRPPPSHDDAEPTMLAPSAERLPHVPLQRPLQIMLYIFLLVGLTCLSLAVWLHSKEKDFRAASEHVEGVVVESVQVRRGFIPVVEFPWNGEKRQIEANPNQRSTVNGRSPYQNGEKIWLWVLRSDPTQVHTDDWLGSWLLVTITGALGTVFTLIATVILYLTRRRK